MRPGCLNLICAQPIHATLMHAFRTTPDPAAIRIAIAILAAVPVTADILATAAALAIPCRDSGRGRGPRTLASLLVSLLLLL